MASLGSVTSTALTGGDAPVFEGVAKEVQAGVEAANKSSNAQVAAMSKEVAELKDLITELLTAQKVNATVAEVDEASAEAPADAVAKPEEPVLNDTAGVTKAKAKAK